MSSLGAARYAVQRWIADGKAAARRRGGRRRRGNAQALREWFNRAAVTGCGCGGSPAT